MDANEEITIIYESKRQEIALRLHEFRNIWKKGTNKEIFTELVFCILTPQANGKLCWSAVENMIRKGVLFTGDRGQIVKELSSARFIHKKSAYIVEAREKFFCSNKVSLKSAISKIGDAYKAREWLVQNVKGIGYKEASHFLRNIGFEQNLAILDRHIIKSLQFVGVIKEIPGSLSKGRYFNIEKRMMEFSKAIQIPMSYLDLVMWYNETGEIFK
ncbi:MAG: N-glycosylase/DNA lyase [Deltaproteobacteria bacterium]|nr:N-glycosylase/DNA lyase [Deltaproteobacteria bacterium]